MRNVPCRRCTTQNGSTAMMVRKRNQDVTNPGHLFQLNENESMERGTHGRCFQRILSFSVLRMSTTTESTVDRDKDFKLQLVFCSRPSQNLANLRLARR